MGLSGGSVVWALGVDWAPSMPAFTNSSRAPTSTSQSVSARPAVAASLTTTSIAVAHAEKSSGLAAIGAF
ncbi:hypothetical protein D3C71_1739440 [compost metagenome]